MSVVSWVRVLRGVTLPTGSTHTICTGNTEDDQEGIYESRSPTFSHYVFSYGFVFVGVEQPEE